MRADRKLDHLIVENIFGITSISTLPNQINFDPPPYSRDIKLAMEVRAIANIKSVVWVEKGKVIAYYTDGCFAEGETEAHAICLAALKAKGLLPT